MKIKIKNTPESYAEIQVEKIKSLSEESRNKLKRFVDIILSREELHVGRGESTSSLSYVFSVPLKLLEQECSCFSLTEAEILVSKLREFSKIDFITSTNKYTNKDDHDYEFHTNNLLLSVNNPTTLKKIGILFDSENTQSSKTTENFKKESQFSTSSKIILKIDKKDKKIIKNCNNKTLSCAFRGGNGKNKRFEYIVKLAQGKKISGSKLSNTSAQNLSTEIGKINKRLTVDLELVYDVIKNDNNSGYEINRDFFEPIFV